MTKGLCLYGLILIGVAWPVWAAPPVISSLTFPSAMEPNDSAVGQIIYQDPDQDVIYARFDVVDGRYYRLTFSAPAMTSAQGHMDFALRCTSYAQQITLALTLYDAAGERSAPFKLTFTCGRPPLYNFDVEQARSLPVSQQIPLNVFILDDGENALSEGATFPDGALLGEPRPEVLQALQTKVLPKLTGIWDQCGLGFELIDAWVVRPDRLTMREGRLVDVEGFSESAWPNYSLVRWGTVLAGVTPKQMIATLAHELGHNLGLGHPGEDGLGDTQSDPLNLMWGSGVSPQPRAHLLRSQCELAVRTLTQLAARLQASATAPPAPQMGEATVRWLSLCPQSVCSRRVQLSVEAEGFPDLQSFSFALFEYSRDGERFVEIGVDRQHQDGFSTLWDTTKLPDGTYILRVTVTDARGVRASVQAQVTLRNG
jgi:hypothetical protein